MWALRRASVFIRNPGLSSASTRIRSSSFFFSSQSQEWHVEDDDDKLDDGFSDLEMPCGLVQESISGDENSDEFSDGDAVADDKENELEASIIEADAGKKRSPKTKATSTSTKVILATHTISMKEVCEKWVEEGNKVTQTEVSLTMLELRKRKMFLRALQLFEWSESSKHLDFLENNYASRVDLVA